MSKTIKATSTLTSLQKRDGSIEAFDAKKLERSLLHAGASKALAQTIISDLQLPKQWSTQQLRSQVSTALHAADPACATRYEQTRTLIPQSTSAIAPGVVRLHPGVLQQLHIQAQAPVMLEFEGHARTALAEEASHLSQWEMELHPSVLFKLGGKSSDKIALCAQMGPASSEPTLRRAFQTAEGKV